MADVDNGGRNRMVTAIAEDRRWVAAYRGAIALLMALVIAMVGWQGNNIATKIDELRTAVAGGNERMNGFDQRFMRDEGDIARTTQNVTDLDRRTTRLEAMHR